MVVDKVLTSGEKDNNFIYGIQSFPVNLISTARYRYFIENDIFRNRALGVVAAHEFIHTFDLVLRGFNVGTVGIEKGHCMGERGNCIMEQADNGRKTATQIVAETSKRVRWLCQDCTEEIQFKLNYFRKFGAKF